VHRVFSGLEKSREIPNLAVQNTRASTSSPLAIRVLCQTLSFGESTSLFDRCVGRRYGTGVFRLQLGGRLE
jgi:hypothetical protein